MVIKTFEFSLLDSLPLSLKTDISSQSESIGLHTFSLDIANKATYVLHRALKIININRSQFTSSTKTKSEVRGGGRKPWKQKGTGNARAGSKRSPLWRGGGVTFGPKPRNIYKKLNKKEKQLALRTLIYNKRNKFEIFHNFEIFTYKTKNILKTFKILNKNEKILFISSELNKNLKLSIRNCQNIKYSLANEMSISTLVKANKIILDQLSFNIIKDLYCEKY